MMLFDFYPFESKVFKTPSGNDAVEIDSELIYKTIKTCFEKLSFTFPKRHLEHLIAAALNPNASDNDRYVCASLLKNATVAAKQKLPLCQDTGIANIFGWKDTSVVVNGDEHNSISNAVKEVYINKKLRFSTTQPDSFFTEHDPKNNLPANVMLFSSSKKDSLPAYHFLCCAKGGGSSNKTSFVQGTKANLNDASFESFVTEKIKALGTSACPPYTIAVVAGGLSPEQNLLALKLATAGCYDSKEKIERLNNSGSLNCNSFRDEEWEKRVLKIAEKTGLGAQFGGTQMALEAIVIRLPRHGASCPLSVGVSCSAHRNLEAYINKDGIYIEQTELHPENLKDFSKAVSFADLNPKTNSQTICLNTDDGIDKCKDKLDKLKCGTRIQVSGTILVARDAAHARWKQLIDNGEQLPDYCTKYPICYAGPAQTPDGYVIGSFGPTTAGRMDSYGDLLMSRGTSLITLAKGNRSKYWSDCCKKYGAFYLGTIGGAAALIAESYITDVKVIDYPELGMEAVRLVKVKNLPAFILTDNKGKDFYE